MAKFTTVYTATGHEDNANGIVQTLSDMGLGRSVIADECRKIAAVRGPRAELYGEAAAIASVARRVRQECNALGGA